MIGVKFTYPKGKAPANRKKFEKMAKEGIRKFFNDERVKSAIKIPKSLRLVVSEDGAITPKLANGAVFDPSKRVQGAVSKVRTIEEICAEFDRLIEGLRQIK
jgi:hypothetical protein